MIDETHNPTRTSWVESSNDHPDFPIQNLPLGIFSRGDKPRGGVAIGDWIVDLKALAASGLIEGLALQAAMAASQETLNSLLMLGQSPRISLRRILSALLFDEVHRRSVEPLLLEAADCTLHLPAHIGNYTDFYAGIHHANNVGRLFRPDIPLLPNYKYVPVGYHGRASSVRVSGTDVPRPGGQRKSPNADAPIVGPTQRLDYELELGVWIGQGNPLGQPIPISEAGSHIAGLSTLNDWSARDIQAWEYQPLGPFLAKSFLTTVSPWVVTAEALAPFRIAQPTRPEGDPRPLPYLWDEDDQAEGSFALELEVAITTTEMRRRSLAPHILSTSAATNLYWTVAQMVAHHTSNGCDMRPGDLLGTGTISAPTEDGYGSLLEISHAGSNPVSLPSGEVRTFLEDGDEIAIRVRASADGFVSIGFGPCQGKVVSPTGAHN